MTPEQWARAKALFGTALEQAPGERAAFLDEACGPGEAEVRREVESLLAAHAESDSFLETPAAGVPGAAEPSLLQEGQTIGRYRLRGLLGAGGMGQVYLAEDPRLRRQIALKLLPRSLSQDSDRLQRFEQEARAASALSHPNVCVIYEVGETGEGEQERRFIAMEYVPGESLRQRLDRHREAGTRMPLEEVLDIVQQAASGLAAAHAAGIVHRDIKPENVMVRPDGLVKLLDFGLAKLAEPEGRASALGRGSGAHTEPGMVLGTVQYMSPEQARGLPVDARTDIWSLGAVLYEMLACRPAFEGPTTTDVMVAVLATEPQPLAGLCEGVPPALQEVITRALQKDRESRYPSMQQMAAELKAVQRKIEREDLGGATPAVAVPRSAAEPGGREDMPRRHRRAIGGVAGALAAWWHSRRQAGTTTRSIAVLPFADLSPGKDQEYFSDGLTEELLNVLAQIPQLRVAARTSAFSFKGKHVPVDSIGRALKVAHVLEGSVRKAGERVRITAQLINASTGFQLWSQSFDRDLKDIFALQDEIARAIAAVLRVSLGVDEPLTRGRETSSTEAHTLYLQGRFFANKGSREGLDKALVYYQQALEHDPDYALVYAGIAEAYLWLGDSYLPPQEVLPQVLAAARRAIDLDDTVADGHAQLALAEVNWGWNWAIARQALDRTLERNPSHAMAHLCAGMYWLFMADAVKAVAEVREAHRLDPLSPIISLVLEVFMMYTGDLDAALAQHEVTQELAPGFMYIEAVHGDVYRDKAMYTEAIEAYGEGESVLGRPASGRATTYVRMGRREEAEQIAKDLECRAAAGEYISPELIARIYVALGNHDRAFEWLEKGVEARSALAPTPAIWTDFAPIRSDPRYRRLRRRMGLAP